MENFMLTHKLETMMIKMKLCWITSDNAAYCLIFFGTGGLIGNEIKWMFSETHK